MVPVYGLSSTDPAVLLGDHTGLGLLAQIVLRELNDALQTDLVVSGGYKLYGIVLTSLLRIPEKKVRLLYIHEEGSRLIQVPKAMKERAQPQEAGRELLEVGMFG